MTNRTRDAVALTWPRVYATVGFGLAVAGAISTAVIRNVSPSPFIGGFGFSEVAMLGYVVSGLSWASVGALLVVRRPENAVGWLMVVVGVGYATSQATVAQTFAFAAAGTPSGDDLARLGGWVTVALQLVTVLQFAIGFLFPTGRPQSPAWARFMRLFWVFAGVFAVISLIQPGPLQLIPAITNPVGFGPDLRGDRPIAPILVVLTLVIFVSLVISMVTRYRSAGRLERQQLQWFAFALGISAIGLGIVSAQAILTARPVATVALAVYVFAGALVPIAIGIAILRYHLYDLNRLVSRTIAYGLISAVLVGGYAALILVLHYPLEAITDGDTIQVALSTLVVAALFQPVRTRIQAIVDRRFDRARYDADVTIRAFAGRLRHDADLMAVRAETVETAAATFHPASAGIWIRNEVRR